MPKITFDVSGSDPDNATKDVEPPKPGLYTCKVAEINPGFSKDSETGKPDKSRPRLEVVYRIQGKKSTGAPLWDYLSFSEASQWKLDQFLQAVGIATKKKRKGSFDTAKVVGKTVKVRVVGEGSGDNYRARVKGVFKFDGAADEDADEEDVEDEEDTDAEDEDEEEDTEDEDAEDEDEDEDSDDEDEDSDEEEDLDSLGAEADAGGKPGKAAQKRLEELAEEKGLDPDDYGTWAELATALQGEEESDGYEEMDIKALRKECRSRELETKGSKEALIERLRDNDKEDPF